MVEPEANFGRAGRSDTYLGELVELNQSDTYISKLDEPSEISDASLELNELSDTEEEVGLVAGRNEPFSAHGKIHKKFNLGRFYTKFDQAFDPDQDDETMAETADSSTKDKPGGLNGEYTDLNPAVETEDELTQIRMFGLLRKVNQTSKPPQKDVFYPFKTLPEIEKLIFGEKKQFASNEFDFVQKQRNQWKRQNMLDDDEKRVINGDRPFTKAKRSNCDMLDQNELLTYANLDQDDETMAETADSSTKDKPGGLNGKYTDLNPAVETEDELTQTLDRGYIKSLSASFDDPFIPFQFQKCHLPSRIISNTQLKMFGLLKKSKLQQDVYFPFKTVLEKEQMIFGNKKQFGSSGFDFVQKQRNQRKTQNRFDDDEKWVRSGDRPFTQAKRSNRDVFDQNELQTYVSLEKMLHKAIHAIRQLKKKGNTNTSSAPKKQSTMVEPEANFGRAGRSDTYLGELVELNQSDTYISKLDEPSEISDASLELNELSDTEEEVGLVAGRNEPFSAHGKIHKKFNLGRFYTKFDQAFVPEVSFAFSENIQHPAKVIFQFRTYQNTVFTDRSRNHPGVGSLIGIRSMSMTAHPRRSVYDTSFMAT
ncbi:hypothetical protein F2Q69_00022191 [Brassica cretica]|uniref:Uncharacterized protein n=1 Tax=Brassica cretica TaxID=69181 RepID=A0A8S9Q891_BRACR|nr:hypothetical protein F2Q69_00022191 [Brassica cretica]